MVDGGRVVFDSKIPWKLPRPNSMRPLYTYTISAPEWQALLARAKQGDAEVEWEVADRYCDGCKDDAGKILVRRSARRAAEWFRRAAEHGHAPAQNHLGVLLGDGGGVERNVPEALFWLRKAYRAGDSCAANNLAVTYRENGKLRMAVRWFRKCVASRDDDALVQLGLHYYWGLGVRKDPTAAVQFFRKATKGRNISEAGRDDAFFYLGLAYLEAQGVKGSVSHARKLFQRANIDNDHPVAFKMLQQLTRPFEA
jgi:TPR repeat protein